jgi:hypothetical protein
MEAGAVVVVKIMNHKVPLWTFPIFCTMLDISR